MLEGPGLAFDFEAVEDEVQLAALNHLPLIRRMDALLTWLGESKPVTATGALKLAVLPDAASAIGLSVAARRRGRPSAPEAAAAAQPGHHLHLVTDEEIRPALVDVTSMWEVPELALAWHCMQMIGLIEVGRTQARSADPSAIWCSGPPTDQISLRQQAVVHLLMAQLQQVEGWGSARDIMKGIHFAALYTAVNGLQVNEDDLISLGRKIGPPVWEDSLPGLVGNILQRYRREGLLVATNLGNQMPAGVKPAVACALTAFDLLQSEIDS